MTPRAGPAFALSLAICAAPPPLARAAAPEEPMLIDAPQLQTGWVVPAARRGGAAQPRRGVPVLLTLPAGWQVGDAAALVLDAPWTGGASRDRLLDALLESGTAVMELAANPSRLPQDLEGLVLGGLVAATRDEGAGLVVAIGTGRGGEAVLRAADDALATTFLGPGGPRLAAAVALRADGAAFAPGRPPAASEGWAMRAPLLCDLLAGALRDAGADAAPLRHDCRAALAPSF